MLRVVSIGVRDQEPAAGTPEDIRFTRSKDNKVLYAIVLGWPGDNEILSITSLSGKNLAVENLTGVSLLGPEEGMYIPLEYHQDDHPLHLTLPEKPADELAYVIKLSFSEKIPY